ncbi:uncharacterized [Tachysurus ichikawai]
MATERREHSSSSRMNTSAVAQLPAKTKHRQKARLKKRSVVEGSGRSECVVSAVERDLRVWSVIQRHYRQAAGRFNPLPGSGRCVLALRAPLAAHHRSFSEMSERKAHTPGQR